MSSATGRSSVVSFGSNYIMQLDAKPGVLGWTCPLAVDADGHPKCYHPQGSPPGLDYLANAGKPGNWWGIACNPETTGKPYVQKDTDPAPGFYVSTTALLNAKYPASSPLRYVHSGEVPFIVLPSKPVFSPSAAFPKNPQQKLGDLACVFHNGTGKKSWAVYADIGPSNKIGEGSMALATALGLSDSPKSGGESKEVIAMIFFPGSKIGWPRPNEELELAAWHLFDQWGGYESAKALLPQINWSQFISALPEPLSGEREQGKIN